MPAQLWFGRKAVTPARRLEPGSAAGPYDGAVAVASDLAGGGDPGLVVRHQMVEQDTHLGSQTV
ncbi:hypothetical protein A5692_14740 [Mycobacterium sp. E342]|nr:hypothetical protein A5692_14740 [Mycobacterium sp. E342]